MREQALSIIPDWELKPTWEGYELQRIREMSDDMFKDYCSSFGKKQITQTIKTISAFTRKLRMLNNEAVKN